jgi:hypothetical protein
MVQPHAGMMISPEGPVTPVLAVTSRLIEHRVSGTALALSERMRSPGNMVVVIMWSFSTLPVGCGGSAGQPDGGSPAPPDIGAGDAAPPAIRHLGIEVDQPAGFHHGAQIDRVTAFGVDSIQLHDGGAGADVRCPTAFWSQALATR